MDFINSLILFLNEYSQSQNYKLTLKISHLLNFYLFLSYTYLTLVKICQSSSKLVQLLLSEIETPAAQSVVDFLIARINQIRRQTSAESCCVASLTEVKREDKSILFFLFINI